MLWEQKAQSSALDQRASECLAKDTTFTFPAQLGHALALNWSSVSLAQIHAHSSPRES